LICGLLTAALQLGLARHAIGSRLRAAVRRIVARKIGPASTLPQVVASRSPSLRPCRLGRRQSSREILGSIRIFR